MTQRIHIASKPANPFPLPVPLEGLRRLAYNLSWSWRQDVRELFKRLDPLTWQNTHSPLSVLEDVNDFRSYLDDPRFLTDYETVLGDFDAYLEPPSGRLPWFERQSGNIPLSFERPLAYFCAEFGLHETLPIYSGGLGVLAGDHLKAASDLGLPFVAVGLLYRQGYFRQSIDADGHQEHAYPSLDPRHLPIERVLEPESGRPLLVPTEIGERTVMAAVWKAQVGRVPLLLLDTDVAENAASDRPITAQLYVRGREMRLHQEMILGIGGVRALRALQIDPGAWHLNEGHSAFLLVERMREAIKGGATYENAADDVRSCSVFTIHTPVSAGNERFDAALVRRLLKPMSDAGVDLDRVLEAGRHEESGPNVFDMTAFSLRSAVVANAVSQLHSETANGTWSNVVERPILGLTNGVHMPTWVGGEIVKLLKGYGCDVSDLDNDDDKRDGSFVYEHPTCLDPAALWEAHGKQKRALSHFVRGRLRKQLSRHGESPSALEELSDMFDPEALTLGFARRFATYKRAALVFSDPERLARLLWNEDRPVQILFAGKAHPADRPGQAVIQQIFEYSRSDRFRGRVFILEDYDMRIGRLMTSGVDVWLNNPLRPLEASGTSGMKAAANGIPNCSILDGWWDEGFADDNGWAIGSRERQPTPEAQDGFDADSLYSVLEEQVVPEYYDLDEQGLPGRWVTRMQRSIGGALWQFSTARMVEEYAERMYLPAAKEG